MSEEKFTPGEWEASVNEVHDDVFDNLEYRIWKRGENKCIAMYETWDEARFVETKANAHLIAAAPRLYRFINRLYNCGLLRRIDMEEAEKLLKEARGGE